MAAASYRDDKANTKINQGPQHQINTAVDRLANASGRGTGESHQSGQPVPNSPTPQTAKNSNTLPSTSGLDTGVVRGGGPQNKRPGATPKQIDGPTAKGSASPGVGFHGVDLNSVLTGGIVRGR